MIIERSSSSRTSRFIFPQNMCIWSVVNFASIGNLTQRTRDAYGLYSQGSKDTHFFLSHLGSSKVSAAGNGRSLVCAQKPFFAYASTFFSITVQPSTPVI